MSMKERIQGLVKEAETYRTMSLLNQSKAKYMELLALVENDPSTSKQKKLIDDIKSRIRSVDDEITEIDQATDSPEVSEDIQDLIRNLFSFSQNQATAAIEGAVALAKFGQYEKAVNELERLVKDGPIPLQAAINLLRCHLSLASPDVAVEQYKQWTIRDELGKGDLKYLRTFLENYFKKRGIEAELPEIGEESAEKAGMEGKSDDIIDLSSLGIQFEGGPYKDKVLEFDVSFQSGNKVSIILPPNKKNLVDLFKQGQRFSDIQCTSPIAIFNGSGAVSGKTRVTTGPKRGSYTIDITLDGR
jgi:tetratricopeptide (TPR) repeat protein